MHSKTCNIYGPLPELSYNTHVHKNVHKFLPLRQVFWESWLRYQPEWMRFIVITCMHMCHLVLLVQTEHILPIFNSHLRFSRLVNNTVLTQFSACWTHFKECKGVYSFRSRKQTCRKGWTFPTRATFLPLENWSKYAVCKWITACEKNNL